MKRSLLLLLVVLLLPATAMAQRTVKLTLNTATLPDTTGVDDLIEVRGAIDGNGGVELPDGNVIDWNESSTLEPVNTGGDYWETTFQIPDNAEMQFKFYSQQFQDTHDGGWEDGDNYIIPGGTGDTTLALHYFVKGDGQPYDWRPFESTDDSVGVWFRVYMNTEDAVTKGYDRAAEMTVGIRGDDFGQTGPLDWGTTKVTLTRESDNDSQPGYDLYSGVAMYPASLAGSVQNFKYFLEPDGWEADQPVTNNRQFTVPTQDTTLQWVYYSNSAPVTGDGPATAFVIFTVDTTPLEDIGLFDRARGDTLEVRGGFNGWSNANPDQSLLFRVPGSNTFENAIALTAIPGAEQAYKFFINFNDENFQAAFGQDPPNGWEEPISKTGANRTFAFEGNPNADQDLGIQFFNDVLPGNIIPDGNSIDVTFSVNMAPAVDNPAQPFVPGTDSVHVDLRGDGLWGFTQGFGDGDTRSIFLEDTDGDMVYTGTFTVNGPTYGAIQYKYGYGLTGAIVDEQGGGFNDVGRRRTRFVAANADGSWPSAWSFPAEDFLVEGLLPNEPNPADPNAGGVSVEEIDGELPATMTLSQNYPNPFNPATTIEYAVNQTMDVKLQVFNVLGQNVATLVNGVQQAATYRVSFDATDLASGIYIYQLETAAGTLTKQMILMK